MPNAPTERTYNTHLGRTQTDPHFFRVELPVTPFSVDGNESEVLINVDLNQWYEQPNVYAFPDAPFIMDKPITQETLRANGSSVFNVELGVSPATNWIGER